MKISIHLLAGILVLAQARGSPIEKNIPEIRQTNDVTDFCVTTECIEASYRFLKAMNQSANPCDDFYEVVSMDKRIAQSSK